ncbi:nad dependent epimerase dehydratase family [Fusarium albosuccineum]|uniref:Nad dependent epimerase dehydratase family n=1 Tax=Fusarium albosuccineum TaxID=1237068 RepID=A0A8H4L2W7_9HYPO|nr:nad dependent epimerase dehydratase family [Fusarium albosuccineum]
MSLRLYPLQSSGIFRNLPQFDPDLTGLTAIVCGASGISGFHALRALLDTPRWSRVFLLSRSPLSAEAKSFLSADQLSRVTHVPVDLLSSAESIARELQRAQVKAGYLFYYAYLQPDSVLDPMSPEAAQVLIDTNAPMLQNLLDALPLAYTVPKRILLQTGGKNYGMHIGRVRTPIVESDPQPRHIADNFYYHQEDAIKAVCEKFPGTTWNVVRPFGIIGAAPNSPLNMFMSFAIYAAVQAHKGDPLEFGGDLTAWQFEASHSSVRLTSYLSEWAVLEPDCANQAFNAVDGGALSWDRFFGALAEWWGVSRGVVKPDMDSASYTEVMTLGGGSTNPLGYGPPQEMKRRFALRQWADDKANEEAWRSMMQSSGGELAWNPFEGNKDAIFSGDFAYLSFGTASLHKTRRFGFNGYVDSLESIHEMYIECQKLRMLPRMASIRATPSI